MWETSRTGSGFPLPACSFCCLTTLPTEKPAISHLLCLYKFNLSIIHVSFALYAISLFHLPTSPIKRPFFALAHISEDLSSSAGVHLSASSTSRSSLSHHNIPLCAASVKCLVVMVTKPRNDGHPAVICRVPRARVESRPGGRVLVWALCSCEIRPNDHRTWNRRKRTQALRPCRLRMNRRPFEERLVLKIVEKGQVTAPSFHLLSMFLDTGIKRRRPSRRLESQKDPGPHITLPHQHWEAPFQNNWVWKFWP